jgi:hypothetical protein
MDHHLVPSHNYSISDNKTQTMRKVFNEQTNNAPYHSTMISTNSKKRSGATSRYASTSSNKRQKLFSPELTVVVGSGTDRSIYLYQPNNMVKHSHYIRTKLVASLMHQQQNPFTIQFPDIEPSDWDLMMEQINPDCSTRLNACDALRLQPLYEKYEFKEGAAICKDTISASKIVSDTEGSESGDSGSSPASRSPPRTVASS